MLHCVITTIQRPTISVQTLAKRLVEAGAKLVIAGDAKGPDDFTLTDVDGFTRDQLTFLSLGDQLGGGFNIARLLPTGHYSRKNVGYLEAIRNDAECIYETDDDNAPRESWQPRTETLASARYVPAGENRWVNVYRYFSGEQIWPRGLPLDEIKSPIPQTTSVTDLVAPIQQGLVNNNPDVDAIWRLTIDRPFDFEEGETVYLEPGNWCPFNTQSTWWWPIAYPLLYVPSYCSFRMCDIWKSFVAQRCLWELNLGVAFHAAEVIQDRNEHDLMKDFEDEIPGYQGNKRLVGILEQTQLEQGESAIGNSLFQCYKALVAGGFFPKKELDLVQAWLEDLGKLG